MPPNASAPECPICPPTMIFKVVDLLIVLALPHLARFDCPQFLLSCERSAWRRQPHQVLRLRPCALRLRWTRPRLSPAVQQWLLGTMQLYVQPSVLNNERGITTPLCVPSFALGHATRARMAEVPSAPHRQSAIALSSCRRRRRIRSRRRRVDGSAPYGPHLLVFTLCVQSSPCAARVMPASSQDAVEKSAQGQARWKTASEATARALAPPPPQHLRRRQGGLRPPRSPPSRFDSRHSPGRSRSASCRPARQQAQLRPRACTPPPPRQDVCAHMFTAGRLFDATRGFPGEGPRSAAVLRDFHVVTVNVNAFSTALQMFRADHFANVHVVCLQETKLVTQEEADQAASQLARLGWQAFLPLALGPDRRHASSGVGIVWRSYLSVVSTPAVIVPGRAAATAFYTEPAGIMQIVSLYAPQDDATPHKTAHDALLHAVKAHLQVAGHPFVVAGDYNASVAYAQEWCADHLDCAAVAAPAAPTCYTAQSATVIDYFLVHHLLLRAAKPPDTWHHTGLAPHVPSVLTISRALVHQPCTVWKRPPSGLPLPVPTVLPQLDYEPMIARMRSLCQQADIPQAMLDELSLGSGCDSGAFRQRKRWFCT